MRQGARGGGRGAGNICGVLLFVVQCSLFLAPGARAETVNGILAIVNDDVITEADVTSRVDALLEDPQASLPPEASAPEMRQAVLQRLIEQRLMLQEAKRSGIEVGTDEVMDRVEALRSRFASEEEFQQGLDEAKISEVKLKEQLRDQVMVERVIQLKIRSTIVVSPQEVAGMVSGHPELAKPGDRVRASHLLVRVNERRSEAQALALIEDLRRQLEHGEDFATLAKRYSEDPNAEQGGAMDWVAPGELMPELDTALFSLKPGELSAPIQTRLGFHLLKVAERRTASSLSVMEAHRAVYQQLYQQKFQQAFTRWLADLKRRAYIEIVSAS